MGKASAKQEVSQFYMSVELGLVHGPVDAITGLFVGEKLAWSGQVTGSGNIAVNAPNLFGGPKSSGGVGGIMVFRNGDPMQVMPAPLAARLGLTPQTCPAHRGICEVWFIGNDEVPAGSVDVTGSGGVTGGGAGDSGAGTGNSGTGGGSGSTGGGGNQFGETRPNIP